MPANEWYKQWFNSPFYHKFYFERDEKEGKIFIDNLVAHLKPQPASRALHFGAGQGRHSRLLASYGFEVTAIDGVIDNVSYASQFADDKLHFYLHDMRLPFWVNYFDLAFSIFTSFGYFPTRREHDDVMRTIAASLKPNGTVVFDYPNLHYAEEHLLHNETKRIGETQYDIHRWHDDQHFYKKIVITDPRLRQPEEHTEKRAKFSLGDFTDMFAFQKLQVTEVFGDYQLSSYDVRKTPRMIVVGKKIS